MKINNLSRGKIWQDDDDYDGDEDAVDHSDRKEQDHEAMTKSSAPSKYGASFFTFLFLAISSIIVW